jgi:hypothetical protein
MSNTQRSASFEVSSLIAVQYKARASISGVPGFHFLRFFSCRVCEKNK